MRGVFLLWLWGLSFGVGAAEPRWQLFARDDGCVDLQLVVRMERLSRAPVSPEDFAQMMRERGERVSMGFPEGFSPNLAGQVVQVSYGARRSLTFVRDEVCQAADRHAR